jgi:hypothetical protein
MNALLRPVLQAVDPLALELDHAPPARRSTSGWKMDAGLLGITLRDPIAVRIPFASQPRHTHHGWSQWQGLAVLRPGGIECS